MARMDSFVEYTLELLEKVGPIQARSMFGGWGVYLGGRMFGLIGGGQLYLKVDDVTKPDFQAAGCRPFVYDGGEKPVEMGYWTPPADAADDAYALLPWARRAVDAANRAALKKAAKKPRAKAAEKESPTDGKDARPQVTDNAQATRVKPRAKAAAHKQAAPAKPRAKAAAHKQAAPAKPRAKAAPSKQAAPTKPRAKAPAGKRATRVKPS